MLNQVETAVVCAFVANREHQILVATGAKKKGTVYHPERGHIIGFNFGSSVRPDVAPIRVNRSGFETMESYLARGGRILTGAPKVATGAALVRLVRSRSTKVAQSRG